jgi:hypothetical protein
MATTVRRWAFLCAAALLAVSATASCTESENQGRPPPSPVELPPPQEGLPQTVATTRGRIYEAAKGRDFESLRALIDRGAFTYSFGDGGDPIRYWMRLEARGEDPLGTMVDLLERPYAVQRGIYVWPEEFATTAEYFDYRIGIGRDGTWIFFVAGD